MGLVTKIFGTRSERELKKIAPLVKAVENFEPVMQKLSAEELRAKTDEFKRRLASGETMDDILPEAFAVAREAGVRVLGKRAYHVQIIGGIILHQGRIAEMKTGEGKTLVAAMPAYLNALSGKGVHIVTVNDYLAKYHSELIGKIFRFLGLTVGLVIHDVTPEQRRAAYAADITYGTNNEFGFDYLRDNMAISKEGVVQRPLSFAIVDEVDSILIDEARTPLIISGEGEASSGLYERADLFASRLKAIRVTEVDTKQEEDENIDGDYIVDEKARTVTLTAHGIEKAERFFNIENLGDAENSTISHHINQAIRARGLMKRDVDYVVKDGEVIIVDEYTGRLMFGRRYSDGLHQAIEAKEGVKVEKESKTLATITFQNYFRLYNKLSGMTGTALTEEEEFREIYRLDVVEIPTNKPMIRKDYPDAFFKSIEGKSRAIIRQIEECHAKGQPVLVGTVSIEKSEKISAMLKKLGIKHNVLNAKYHEQEAEIVAQAGKLGAVTIATNMAGRGTDIMLGGNAEFMARHELKKRGYPEELVAEADGQSQTEDQAILDIRAEFNELVKSFEGEIKEEAAKVIAAGGLFIVGSERHESRRIDNQLRGRAGRQGDPGESRFFISAEDDLLRLFAQDKLVRVMNSVGVEDDMQFDQKVMSNIIESAQKRVESRNYQARKTVLEYDNVMNSQREIIYSQRNKVLNNENLRPEIIAMIEDSITRTVQSILGEQDFADTWQIDEICAKFEGVFLEKGEISIDKDTLNGMKQADIANLLIDKAKKVYDSREREFGEEKMRYLERRVLLYVVDRRWMDHIDAMQELKQGIGLRAYGQNDPKKEYQREGFDMFEEMINGIRDDTARMMFLSRITDAEPQKRQVVRNMVASHGDSEPQKKQPVRAKGRKIGPNELCPCGSGLKFKRCHGRDGSKYYNG